MPERPTFEFLLPLYGSPELCRLAISSVLSQTVSDFRLTIVDDSFPSFPLGDYLRRHEDARLHYFQNDSVLGAGGNFRRVLSLATADRVTFMGADDVLHPRYLGRMIEMAERFPSADVIQPGVRVINAAGDPSSGPTDRIKRLLAPSGPHDPTLLSGEALAVSLLRGNWTYFPSLLWKRETITKIGFRDYDVVQDLGLLLDVIAGGGSMLVDPRLSFDYRRHGGAFSSITAATGARFEEEVELLADLAVALERIGWRRAVRTARWRPSSRLHATLLAATSVNRGAAARLIRLAFGR